MPFKIACTLNQLQFCVVFVFQKSLGFKKLLLQGNDQLRLSLGNVRRNGQRTKLALSFENTLVNFSFSSKRSVKHRLWIYMFRGER